MNGAVSTWTRHQAVGHQERGVGLECGLVLLRGRQFSQPRAAAVVSVLVIVAIHAIRKKCTARAWSSPSLTNQDHKGGERREVGTNK